MKRALLILSSIWLLLAPGPAARAQLSAELQAFQEAAGDHGILFRGKQATRYTFLFNGNPYWDNATFGIGDIVCEGNFYHGMTLNINAHKQQVLVRMADSPHAIALTPSQVPSFTIDGRRYVGIASGDVLPEGIYAVLGDGPVHIYKHVEKYLYYATKSVNGDLIGYYDPDYRADISRYFHIRTFYYFQDADGNFSRIRTRGALLRKFPGRKKEIRQALYGLTLDPTALGFDAYCEAVLNIVAP